jgi:hypothetical protein
MDMLQQRTALFPELVLTTLPCCCYLQTHQSSHHEHHMVNSSTSQMGDVISERPVAVGVAEVSWLCGVSCTMCIFS